MLGSCATVKSSQGTTSGQEAFANLPVRRNISSLAPDHPIIVAFKSAVTQMKALPAEDRRSWTNQASIHQKYCPHGNWLFLPWHRAYLLYFERICRKLSGMADFALPYWNWSLEPRVPAVFWGGRSNPLFDDTRGATATSVASRFNVGAPVIASILDEPNFLAFASGRIGAAVPQHDTPRRNYGRLEATPHNYIHGFVGGIHMGTFMSPLDPIFWVHHNMVERCWVEWNFDKNHPNTNDSAWLNREFTEFCDEDGNPVTVSVAASLQFPVSAYRYDDVGPEALGPTATASAREFRAMQDRSQAQARAGAEVRLEVIRRFAAPQPFTVALDRPTSVRIAVAPQVVSRVGNIGGRPLLAFDVASLDSTKDFSVRVFVNKPDASVDTSPSDPHFAGAFAFFDHEAAGHDHGDGGSFILDVSDVLRRLNIEGGTIEVNVVLAPYPGRQPRTRVLTLTTTELRIVKDVVER